MGGNPAWPSIQVDLIQVPEGAMRDGVALARRKDCELVFGPLRDIGFDACIQFGNIIVIFFWCGSGLLPWRSLVRMGEE